MTRYLFPQDRVTFLYTGPGEPIRQPWETQLTLYVDEALTTLADVQTPAGDTIIGSIIFVGDDGLIPQFKGPNDGTTTVWAKPPDAPAYALSAVSAAGLFDPLGSAAAAQSAAIAASTTALNTAITNLVGTAPTLLDTLGEIAAALNNDANAVSTILTRIAHQPEPMFFFKNGDQVADYVGNKYLYNDTEFAWELRSVRAQVTAAPTGSLLRTELALDDTVVFTVDIADGTLTTKGDPTTPSPITVQPGSRLSVNVPLVGSTTPGTDLQVEIVVRHVAPTP